MKGSLKLCLSALYRSVTYSAVSCFGLFILSTINSILIEGGMEGVCLESWVIWFFALLFVVLTLLFFIRSLFIISENILSGKTADESPVRLKDIISSILP